MDSLSFHGLVLGTILCAADRLTPRIDSPSHDLDHTIQARHSPAFNLQVEASRALF